MNLLFCFFLALFIALFRTALLPTLPLFAFAPFLALVYQKKSLLVSLFWALLCGLIMDLLNADHGLGIFALNLSLTTLVLHKYKRHVFTNSSLAIMLFTFLISLFSTLLHILTLVALNNAPPLSLLFVFTDLLLMPVFDALYALIWFIIPIKLVQHVNKKGWKQLLFKEKI